MKAGAAEAPLGELDDFEADTNSGAKRPVLQYGDSPDGGTAGGF